MDQSVNDTQAQSAPEESRKPVLGIISAILGGIALIISPGSTIIMFFLDVEEWISTLLLFYVTITILSAFGLISGIIQLKSDERGKKAATAGIVCSCVSLILSCALPIFYLLADLL